MTNLHEWAQRWGVPWQAVNDLRQMMGLDGTPATATTPQADSEAGVQNLVRLEAGRKGVKLWRNNVGAFERADGGGFIRFGLANDSAALNEKVKSADLIGIRPVVITSEYMGSVIGQFVSREIKAPGWVYKDTKREKAQKKWAEIVIAAGGDAGFCTGEGSL